MDPHDELPRFTIVPCTVLRCEEASGVWHGHTVHGPQRQHMEFADGVVRGEGEDGLGRFVLEGRYNRPNSLPIHLGWIQTAPSGHRVLYLGQYDGRHITGEWDMDGGAGRFTWTADRGGACGGARICWRGPEDGRQIAAWKRRILEHLSVEHRSSMADAPGVQRLTSRQLPRTVVATRREPGLAWPRILRELLPCADSLRPRLLAAIDTSWSMSEEALGLVAGELERLTAHAEVTVVECDAAVQRAYPARAVTTVLGGGDTSFAPVLALAQHERAGIVCFTDGKGHWPPESPSVPVLWVLTHQDRFACPYGLVARLA